MTTSTQPSALPYVALVLYAAQQVEGEQPEFARQLVEAARYFEGLIELEGKILALPQRYYRGSPLVNGGYYFDVSSVMVTTEWLAAVKVIIEQVRDAADRREPRR